MKKIPAPSACQQPNSPTPASTCLAPPTHQHPRQPASHVPDRASRPPPGIASSPRAPDRGPPDPRCRNVTCRGSATTTSQRLPPPHSPVAGEVGIRLWQLGASMRPPYAPAAVEAGVVASAAVASRKVGFIRSRERRWSLKLGTHKRAGSGRGRPRNRNFRVGCGTGRD
jgi:hypothetical protein